MAKKNILDVALGGKVVTRAQVEKAIAHIIEEPDYRWLDNHPAGRSALIRTALAVHLGRLYHSKRKGKMTDESVYQMVAHALGNTLQSLAGLSLASEEATAQFISALRTRAELWMYDPSKPNAFADFAATYLYEGDRRRYGEFIFGRIPELLARFVPEVTMGELLFTAEGDKTPVGKMRLLTDAIGQRTEIDAVEPERFRRLVAEVMDPKITADQFRQNREKEGSKKRHAARLPCMLDERRGGEVFVLVRAPNQIVAAQVRNALQAHIEDPVTAVSGADVLSFLGLAGVANNS